MKLKSERKKQEIGLMTLYEKLSKGHRKSIVLDI